MGVVSGIPMSFQFGTNWSVFSQAGGNVLGPLLGYEVLTAFFLEASFLGIMLIAFLLALVFLGVAFKFRGKANTSKVGFTKLRYRSRSPFSRRS